MAVAHVLPPTDEVGGIVVDIGSYSSRAGYAGEDTPKVCVVPGNLFSSPNLFLYPFSSSFTCIDNWWKLVAFLATFPWLKALHNVSLVTDRFLPEQFTSWETKAHESAHCSTQLDWDTCCAGTCTCSLHSRPLWFLIFHVCWHYTVVCISDS